MSERDERRTRVPARTGVAVSASPQDMNETNAFNPTDLELIVNPR